MIFRVVNLGDIHFETKNDVAADKGRQLGRTIASSLDDVAHIVIAVNGDLTYSGSNEQFRVGATFLQDIRREILRERSGLSVSIFCTPGNHDCDFGDDQSARNILLTELTTEQPPTSIEKNILAPLKAYFQFVDETHDVCGIDRNAPYLFQTMVGRDDSHIEVVLLNSAWMSSKHERPGSLLFPLKRLSALTKELRELL